MEKMVLNDEGAIILSFYAPSKKQCKGLPVFRNRVYEVCLKDNLLCVKKTLPMTTRPATVETTSVQIESIKIDKGSYRTSQEMIINVSFDDDVVVEGSHYIFIGIGGNKIRARLFEKEGRTLRFRHVVGEEDYSLDGVAILSDIETLDGGQISSKRGADVDLSTKAFKDNFSLIKVLGGF